MNLQNLVEDSNLQLPSEPMFNPTEEHGFDYDILEPKTQIIVKLKAAEIKSLIRQAAKDILNVGQKLSEVKQQLKHGEFRNWLKTEFNWSISSATKFMQVSERFKNVNFTHFNFAASALYILAAPSTPENARQHALQLANRGENITYSLAKLIVKYHKESAETNPYSLNELDSTKITQLDTQLASSVIDVTDDAADKSVKIVEIKQEKLKHIEDKIQDFEIIYAGICIVVKGSPKHLTILFKKMQNSPQFAEDIFKQAKL